MSDNNDNKPKEGAPTEPPVEPPVEPPKPPVEKTTDEKIEEAKIKELDLLEQKNTKLEESLKGQGYGTKPESPTAKIDRECNEFLKGTGMKI